MWSFYKHTILFEYLAQAGGRSMGQASHGVQSAHGSVAGQSGAFGQNSGSSAVAGQASGFNNVASSSAGQSK